MPEWLVCICIVWAVLFGAWCGWMIRGYELRDDIARGVAQEIKRRHREAQAAAVEAYKVAKARGEQLYPGVSDQGYGAPGE